VTLNDDAEIERLRTLKHIVVVMMENRSFDHMLGYLRREGVAEVDGLSGDEFNLDPEGNEIRVQAFDAEAAKIQRRGEALQKRLDPDHSPRGVRIQLGPGYGELPNGGFVRSFIESRKPADKVGKDLWIVPMGYYTSKDVPVYDYLARQYCVCDRWYASIPGDTWPNRLYATTGAVGPNVAQEWDLWQRITDLPPFRRLRGMPLFDAPAFTRQLRRDQWRWYSHDPGTLRVIDATYRNLDNPMRDNFAFFDRRKVNWLTETLERPIVRGGSFLDDAARNTLPAVSWIDPNFVDLSVLETNSNDDHPPSDIRAGQAFVFEVYDALLRSKHWDDTLLVVTYDEHGGFYDHVAPPQLPASDAEARRHRTYGVRVPTLIVGPRVRRHALHEPPRLEGREKREQPQFDHTSLIKTILLAFARNPGAAMRRMPARVQRAPHLGGVLLDEPRTDIDDPRNTRELMEMWRQEARRRRAAVAADADTSPEAGEGTRSVAPDGAGHPLVLTDFQADWQKFAIAMRKLGVEV
jgi:phospholipase C